MLKSLVVQGKSQEFCHTNFVNSYPVQNVRKQLLCISYSSLISAWVIFNMHQIKSIIMNRKMFSSRQQRDAAFQNSVKQPVIKNIQGAYLLNHQMGHKSYYKQFSEDCAHTSV